MSELKAASGLLTEDGHESAISVIRRGVATTPDFLDGIVFTAFLGVFVAAGQIASPVVMQMAIDRGGLASGNVEMDKVTRFALIGVAVFLASTIMGLIVRIRMIRRAEKGLKKLRIDAFKKVHSLTLADHNETATGVLISRITSDIDALMRFVQWGLYAWIVEPVVVISVLGVIAWYSWPMALITVVVLGPIGWILRWIQGPMSKAHDGLRTAVGELLGTFSEVLSGAEVVRAYGAESQARERLETASKQRYKAGLKANVFMATIFVIGDMFSTLLMGLIVVIGVTFRETLGLTAGTLIAILTLITLLQQPIAEFGETLNNAQQAIAGWRKVLNLLDIEVEDLDPVEGEDIPAGPVTVDTNDLCFAYRGGEQVLHDVSLHIPAGTRVAIVGETGSGKSTFAKLLARLADPTSGCLKLSGVDITKASAASRHKAVRLVPQDGFLFDVSVRENISYGRSGVSAQEVEDAVDTLSLREWANSLSNGLDTRVGERGSQLSVGERQLVSFARAAVANPGLLILDEATSSVDPHTDVVLTRAVERLAVGRTVISIAHRLSTAMASDLVLVLEQGRLVEQGHHDELVEAGGLYAGLFAAWQAKAEIEV